MQTFWIVGRNLVHWKNIVADENQFRNDLLRHLKVARPEWDAYGEKIRDFRNWDAAHYDERGASRKLTLILILRSRPPIFYYAYLVAELAKHDIQSEPLDLSAFSEAFMGQARLIADAAWCATKHMEEKVTISG